MGCWELLMREWWDVGEWENYQEVHVNNSVFCSEVSYGAQHDILSDKVQFPSFLRTVPRMRPQSTAFALLVKYFGWTWIGLLSGDNDTCYMWRKDLEKDLRNVGVCVSFWEKVHYKYSKERMRSIAEGVQSSSAKVIICDCTEMELTPLLQELSHLNVTDRMWIFTNSLTITSDYFPWSSLRLLNGSLAMVLHAPDMPELKPFLESLHPDRFPEDIFIHSFWEAAFWCKWSNNAISSGSLSWDAKDGELQCIGTEVLEDVESIFVLSDMSYTYHIYLAVYALAQALQDLISCTPGMGPFENSSCAEVEHPKPWQMLHYVRHVRFITSSGEEIFFDENGDVPAVFDFVNIQISSEGSMRLVKVVTYDSSAPEGRQIRIEEDAMMWNTGDNQAPSSFCSESCLPGFRQSVRKGWPVCCFDCVSCSAGEISNEIDSAHCWPCSEDHWPNAGRTECELTTLQFLSLEEPLGIIFSSLTILLFLITLFVLCVFRRFQDTPIVKANHRGLSYVLLIALMLCFLSPFTFIGHPMRATCMIRQNSFGIIFSISISTILAKTITVIIAFNARDPTSRSSRWLGTRMPSGVVLLCSFAPVLICTVWLLLGPPFPVKIQIRDTTILQCDEGSVLFFYLMLGYLGLLATVTFVVAFYARNLPQSFNEAKFLTFSMLVFLAVWVSFIPAYLSTNGKYLVAVEIFAILSSGAGLLGCIFIPKCYIILWRPDMNTKQYLVQRTSCSKNK
ncbi:extracellular calcium-sensing receptor-like [Lissotriton helveticus]